jgi:hypothetical protein
MIICPTPLHLAAYSVAALNYGIHTFVSEQ